MKKYLLFLLIPLCGCIAGYNLHHLEGTVTGNALSTPAGPASGQVHINSWTCISFNGGKCPVSNAEIVNAN